MGGCARRERARALGRAADCKAVLEEEAMLPWEAAAVGVSGERQLPLRELEALRQKHMRATEELCSVRREVGDVVRF